MLLQPMTTSQCSFPLFRDRFLGAAPPFAIPNSPRGLGCLGQIDAERLGTNAGASTSCNALPLDAPQMPRLDLTAVHRQDAQPTEVGARRHKMATYEKQCSQILDGLYISGEWVAKDLQTLQMNGITHVINCVGAIYGEFFSDKIKYLTLYLRDIPEENIMCVLHDCFDFIDKARQENGRVLVHCSQGVSRSATVVIGYSMWKLEQDYNEVFEQVKNIREVVCPNSGFQLDLLAWQLRRTKGVKSGAYINRLAPQSSSAPLYIVPKAVLEHTWSGLDSRGVFIIQVYGKLYVWVGRLAHQALIRAANGIAARFVSYDYTVAVLVDAVDEGSEPDELAFALTARETGPPPSARIRKGAPMRHNTDYTSDYELLENASPRTSSAAGGPLDSVTYTGSAENVFRQDTSDARPLGSTGGISAVGGMSTARGPVPPLRLRDIKASVL